MYHSYIMKRTQIYLDERQSAELGRRAAVRGTTTSKMIREAIDQYLAGPDEEADRLALWELGLGRVRVLSAVGRDDAAMRWYDGERGPRSPLALAAPAHCRSCGFLLPLAGALRQLFGVCTNEHAPDDGAVVSLDHGCGAHSEAVPDTGPVPVAGPVVDELGYDLV